MPGETAPVHGSHEPAEQTEKINDVRRVDYNIETGNSVRYNPYGDIEVSFDASELDTGYQR